MGTWQRKTAGVIVALVGVVLIGSVVVNDLFTVGPAFEDMSDGFRPVMTEEAIATLEQDLQAMQAASEEFQTTGVPMFSDALGMSPEEFTAFMQEQYPDVATGMEQLPAITESFGGVVGTLEAEIENFASAHAIPTTSLPATTIPWAMLVAGIALIVLGIILGIADRVGRTDRTIERMTLRHSVYLGLAQACALVPGVSRSGATISMGRFLGYDRAAATRFAFLLAIPAVVGAGLFELKEIPHGENAYGPGPTFVATVVSFLVGYAAIAWLLRYVTTRSYLPFVVYRILLGGGTLLLVATGVLSA